MASSTLVSRMLLLVLAASLAASTSEWGTDVDECEYSKVSVDWLCKVVITQGADPTPTCCEGLMEMKRNASACFCKFLRDCTNTSSPWSNVESAKMMQAPSFCGVPLGISDCPAILGLSADSPDAAMFKESATNSSSSPSGDDDEFSFSPTGTAASANEGVGLRIFSLGILASSTAVAAWVLA